MAKVEGLSLQEQILANLAKMQPDLAAAFSSAPRRTSEAVRQASSAAAAAAKPDLAGYKRQQANKQQASGVTDQSAYRSLYNHGALAGSSFSPCADESCTTCSAPVEAPNERDGAGFRTFNAVRRETLEKSVPSKGATKKRGKLTRGTRGQFGREALQGVPGGGLKGFYQIAKMIDAEGTGCRVAEDLGDQARSSLEERLSRSAKNSNTTATYYEARRTQRS